MTRKHNMTGRALSLPAGLAVATGINMGLTLVLSVILAKLVSAERLEWERVGYGIAAMVFVVSMTGTKIGCSLIKRQKLLVCSAISILYFLCLLLVTALFFGGQYSGIGITAVIILCGSGMVCIYELRREGGRNNRVHGRTIKKAGLRSAVSK